MLTLESEHKLFFCSIQFLLGMHEHWKGHKRACWFLHVPSGSVQIIRDCNCSISTIAKCLKATNGYCCSQNHLSSPLSKAARSLLEAEKRQWLQQKQWLKMLQTSSAITTSPFLWPKAIQNMGQGERQPWNNWTGYSWTWPLVHLFPILVEQELHILVARMGTWCSASLSQERKDPSTPLDFQTPKLPWSISHDISSSLRLFTSLLSTLLIIPIHITYKVQTALMWLCAWLH